MILGFIATHIVMRVNALITMMASALNELSLNPRTTDAGMRLVELAVLRNVAE